MIRRRGQISFRGAPMTARATENVARLGVAHVPDGRGTFTDLTVDENLRLGAYTRKDRRAVNADFERVFGYFPRLAERRRQQAGTLSGGEQQMLALARTLMGDPSFVIVDEPTEGLAPQVVAQVSSCLKKMRERGVAILLIEQRMSIARELATRVAVMGHGKIVFDDTPAALAANERVINEWLSVGG